MSDADHDLEHDLEEPGVIDVRDFNADRQALPAWAAGVDPERVDATKAGLTPFVASTSDEDRHLSVIDQSSWRLKNFRANPVILWQHSRGLPPIGRGHNARIEGRGTDDARLMIDVEWDREDPTAAIIANKYDRGILTAGSVGFRALKAPTDRSKLDKTHKAYRAPKEGDSPWWPALYYSGQELLEFSGVTVPSNVGSAAQRDYEQAQQYAREAEDEREQVRRALEELAPKRMAAWLLSALPHATNAQRVAIRAALFTSPEPEVPGFPAGFFPPREEG